MQRRGASRRYCGEGAEMTCRSEEMAHDACFSLRQPSLLAISCSWCLLHHAIVYCGHLRACTGHACSASRCRNRIQCQYHWCAAWILDRSVFVFCSATSCAVVHGLLVGACPQRGLSPNGTEGRRVWGGCGVLRGSPGVLSSSVSCTSVHRVYRGPQRAEDRPAPTGKLK